MQHNVVYLDITTVDCTKVDLKALLFIIKSSDFLLYRKILIMI